MKITTHCLAPIVFIDKCTSSTQSHRVRVLKVQQRSTHTKHTQEPLSPELCCVCEICERKKKLHAREGNVTRDVDAKVKRKPNAQPQAKTFG